MRRDHESALTLMPSSFFGTPRALQFNMSIGRAGTISIEHRPGAVLPVGLLLIITIARFGVPNGVGASAMFLLSLLAHECSHLLVAWLTGTRSYAIGFCVIGAYHRREPAQAAHEFLISLAGPAANLLIAAFLYRTTGIFGWVAKINAVLAVCNLLPCWNSDGHRMLALVCDYFARSSRRSFRRDRTATSA